MNLFRTAKPLIAMLHVPALPGSPLHRLGFHEIRDWVLRDADVLAAGGFDGFILENFGDVPFYAQRVPPHTVAWLAVLAREVKSRFDLPLGINVLRNDGMSALAVATAASADFVRINVYAGARLTDQGVVTGQAHRIQRYRKLLGSTVRVFADVNVKHSAALAPRSVADETQDTIHRGLADAVIVSGAGTGKETPLEDLRSARAASRGTPVYAGSGVSRNNVASVLAVSDGAIVGTDLKQDGITENPVDPERVREFERAVDGLHR